MNDKIRELAVEAGLGRERWNTTTQFEAFLQKFGDLIVQECINKAFHNGHPDLEFLITHFGVES